MIEQTNQAILIAGHQLTERLIVPSFNAQHQRDIRVSEVGWLIGLEFAGCHR
jgi:hypothetical protein